eukprot:jgi/Chlat1/3474/Chrsp23S03675
MEELIKGARVALVTSSDTRHPADNVLDGNDSTFWVSTGGYPQALMLKFESPVLVGRVRLYTTNARKVVVERCESAQLPGQFEKVFEVELPDKGNRMQMESHQVRACMISRHCLALFACAS